MIFLPFSLRRSGGFDHVTKSSKWKNVNKECRRYYGIDFSLACIDLSQKCNIFKHSYHRFSFIVLFVHYLTFRERYVIKTLFSNGRKSVKTLASGLGLRLDLGNSKPKRIVGYNDVI